MSRFVARILAITLLASTCLLAADGPATAKKKPAKKMPPKAPSVAEQMQALKDQLNQQQSQIKQQQDQINSLQGQLQQSNSQLQGQAQQLQASVQQANQNASAAQQTANGLNASVADLKTTAGNLQKCCDATDKRLKDLETPLAVHYKGITFSPGGYVQLQGIFRTRNDNSYDSINYTGIPLSGTTDAKMYNFRMSARTSRISFRADAMHKDTKVLFFWGLDWAAQAPAGAETQTYSFQPRIREFYFDVKWKSGWQMTAGTTWTLITPNLGPGIDPTAIWASNGFDFNTNIGVAYRRAPLLRISKNIGDKAWFSIEAVNPSTTDSTTVLNQVPNGTTPTLPFINPVSGFQNSPNTQVGASGYYGFFTTSLNVAAGSATAVNPATGYPSTNIAPDIDVKLKFQPGFGSYEIVGQTRWFQNRVVCQLVLGCANGTLFDMGKTNRTEGFGLGFNAVLPVIKNKADFIVHTFGGRGIGVQDPFASTDVTLKPNGSIAAIPAVTGVVGLELHPRPNLDVYAYIGAEYIDRTIYPFTGVNGQPGWIGYGVPTAIQTFCGTEVLSGTANPSCSSVNRQGQQIQIGFWHRPWRGPEGTLQWGLGYSWLKREIWTGTIIPQNPSLTGITATSIGTTANEIVGTTKAPIGIQNAFAATIRYYLP
jgi:uncharacterized coiled-coil protein SlyX